MDFAGQVTFERTQVQQDLSGKVEEQHFFVPASRHLMASFTTAAMAWDDSGAGTMPSLRANKIAASNTLVW
jgi:hypothetical protein